MIRPFLLIGLVAGLLLPARAQTRNAFDVAPFEAAQRAMNAVGTLNQPFRETGTVNASAGDAPFDNLPFLRLREGDQIVRGQIFSWPFVKDDPPADANWSDPGLWLRRGDDAVALGAAPQNGRLQLTNASDIARFSWQPTRQNADALFEFWRQSQNVPSPNASNSNSPTSAPPTSAPPTPTSPNSALPVPASQSLTLAQLQQLDALLQPDFAEYQSERLSQFLGANPQFQPGFQKQTGTGDNTIFVYAGLGFNAKDGVYQYRWTLSNQGWNEERATLIWPPVPVSASSRFQQALPPSFLQALPDDAQKRVASQNARLDKFTQIVKSVLDAPGA